jgi:hypothetical protein
VRGIRALREKCLAPALFAAMTARGRQASERRGMGWRCGQGLGLWSGDE